MKVYWGVNFPIKGRSKLVGGTGFWGGSTENLWVNISFLTFLIMILLQCNGKIGQYRYSIFPSGEEGLWSSLRSTLKDRDTGGNIAGPGHGEEYQSSLTRGGRRHGEDGLSCHL